MTNRSKARGTAAETAVVEWLREHGFPLAERRALNGSSDRGDVAGIVGVVVEIKNCAKTELAAWVDEANIEAVAAHAPIGIVVHKRRRKGDPGHWFATCDLDTMAMLLRDMMDESEEREMHLRQIIADAQEWVDGCFGLVNDFSGLEKILTRREMKP